MTHSLQTPQGLWINRASQTAIHTAQREGRVPVAFMWGPDVREAWSRWLDKDPMQKILANPYEFFDKTPFSPPDDGRICDWMGLPVYPMQADGVALRTVAEQ